MPNDFVYGRCLPWRATISTEFCRRYKASGRDKCQNCEGLIMDDKSKDFGARPEAVPPGDEKARSAREELKMDGQNKEQAARIEPGRPQEAKRRVFGSYLKTLMDNKGVRAKDVADAAGVSAIAAGKWLKGIYMPTAGQAEALDGFFGSNLAETYRDQLRPDKDPADKDTRREKPKKPAGPKAGAVLVGGQSEAIADFLKDFGDKHAAGRPTAIEDISFPDEEAALDVLRRVLECLKLILQGRANPAV